MTVKLNHLFKINTVKIGKEIELGFPVYLFAIENAIPLSGIWGGFSPGCRSARQALQDMGILLVFAFPDQLRSRDGSRDKAFSLVYFHHQLQSRVIPQWGYLCGGLCERWPR